MIKEIKVKTALSPSQLPGLDYALNPYRGCAHACVYCYAPSVIHWDKGKWGELVAVKVNLPRILSNGSFPPQKQNQYTVTLSTRNYPCFLVVTSNY